MDDAVVVQRGLDLLSLMTMDPEGVWATFTNEQRATAAHTLRGLTERAAALQTEQDAARGRAEVIALTTEVVRLVEQTPALRALLLPADADSGVLSATRADLGDTENEQRAQAQQFAAQIHNTLVLIQQAAPTTPPAEPPPQSSQS